MPVSFWSSPPFPQCRCGDAKISVDGRGVKYGVAIPIFGGEKFAERLGRTPMADEEVLRQPSAIGMRG